MRLGLSARQLAMLEEYADALRFGRDEAFTGASADGGGDNSDGSNSKGPNAAAGIGARAIKELEEVGPGGQLQPRDLYPRFSN